MNQKSIQNNLILIEELKNALLSPTTIYTNGKSFYNNVRERIINEYGYDEFRELQKHVFKIIFGNK